MTQHDPFDPQGAANHRVRRDLWLLGLLFLPDMLDLARSRSWREFLYKLVRKVRDLTFAVIIVVAAIFLWHALGSFGRPAIGNLIPPPPAAGCPPAYSTAAASDGGGYVAYWAREGQPPEGLTVPQQTALANGEYTGCP